MSRGQFLWSQFFSTFYPSNSEVSWGLGPWHLDFQNKSRISILAKLDKQKRKLFMQDQSSTGHLELALPCLSRPSLNEVFQAHAEQHQQPGRKQLCDIMHVHLIFYNPGVGLGILVFHFNLTMTRRNKESMLKGSFNIQCQLSSSSRQTLTFRILRTQFLFLQRRNK